jgi:hypothetical protein
LLTRREIAQRRAQDLAQGLGIEARGDRVDVQLRAPRGHPEAGTRARFDALPLVRSAQEVERDSAQPGGSAAVAGVLVTAQRQGCLRERLGHEVELECRGHAGSDDAVNRTTWRV